jgi:peptidoglycan-N-acetylglucosamine deacetylase
MRRRLALLLAGALVVAACGGGATPTPGPSPSPTPAPTDIFAQSPTPSVVASPAPEASAEPGTPTGGTTYKVKPGDIMITIAKKFGITVAALKKANPTVDPTKMHVGSELIIPPK